MKRIENAPDVPLWEWIEKLVLSLGEDGMSSDESEIDDRTLESRLRVNVLPWRREEIKQHMMLLDDQRENDAELYTKKGSKPAKRERGGGKDSERAPCEGLPKALYHQEWLKKQTHPESLNISTAKFKWYNVSAAGDRE